MSELRVDNIVDMGGSGAPQLRKGANVTGISTITQAVVGNATINAGGINATGIVTSSSNKFVGDLASGNITAGVMTATSSVVASNITINSGGVNASGIVSATSYIGSGANLSGIGLTIAPFIYSPTLGATNVALQPTIELSVNQRIKAGIGSVSLRQVSAGSTVIETFGLGISTSTTYTVTVASSKFYLDGNQTYSPTLYPGGIYTFDQSAATNSGHPLRFATAADAAGSTEYTTGVETNGTPGNSGAYTRITVATDAPTPLYYYCTNHSSMGSSVTIGKNVSIANDGTLPKLSFTPTNSLSNDSVIFVDIPAGAFKTMPGTDIAATNWTFTTRPPLKWFTWGRNQEGDLGQNNRTKYSSPVQVGSASGWNALLGSDSTIGATKDNGELWITGKNDRGQLGQNTSGANSRYSSPVQIPGTTWDATNVDPNATNFNMCLRTDGTLWMWGNNPDGNLGVNDTTQRSSPTQIPGTTWSTAFTHGGGGGGVKTDGTLWIWGNNSNGYLGQNNTTQYSSPKQIPGTTWKQGAGMGYGVAATKTDGTMWSWGDNSQGALGLNSRTEYSSPVQIPGTTWNKVFSNGLGGEALKTDGTMWTWGVNELGQLGQNDVVYRSSPTQIPGTTWSVIGKGGGGGGSTSMAIKTDGTMWAWGRNDNGAGALNNTTVLSSPVQVPGTTWDAVMNNQASAGLKA